MDVSRHGDTIWTFQEFPDDGYEARAYYRQDDGSWEPPLPLGVEVPERSGGARTATEIERIGGASSFGVGRTGSRPRTAMQRPKWQLGSTQREYAYKDVEIRTRPSEGRQFSVSLGSTAREFIRDELARVRRHFGEPRETGGWLFATERPRAWWDHLTVALATTAGSSQHERHSFAFGATADEISRHFPPHLVHLQARLGGDWHSHAIPGSTIPSDSDARAWTLMRDQQALECYIGLIVSPSESLGWTSPVYSAWTIRREGPSRKPICEPAKLEW